MNSPLFPALQGRVGAKTSAKPLLIPSPSSTSYPHEHSGNIPIRCTAWTIVEPLPIPSTWLFCQKEGRKNKIHYSRFTPWPRLHSIEQHHEQQFTSTGAFWVLCLTYRCVITEPRSCTLYAVIQWTKPSSFLSDINTIPIHHSSLRTPDEKLVQLLTPYSNSTLTEAGLTEMAHK